MSANTSFRSPSSSDSAILKAFKTIVEKLEQNSKECRVNVTVMQNDSPSLEMPLPEIQDHPVVKLAEQHESASWHRVWIEFGQLDLRLYVERDRTIGDDKIEVRFGQTRIEPIDVSRALLVIQEQFIPLNRSAAIERALGPELAEFYRLREVGLSRLEALTQKLTEETHSYRMKLDAELIEHKRELTESLEAKERTIDAHYQERNAGLDSREQELERLRLDLDDRTARHARREQSRALQEKISRRSEDFSLTRATRNKRIPVHLIFIVLLSLSSGLIAVSLLYPVAATEGAEFWLGLVRLPIGALGFALTALFYIRWTDQWFRQHANQEFRLQQLALDVDRAGYATEMLMEWQEDKGGEMPAVLVDRLTAGLFTDQTTATRVQHPSEDVTATLLKAASGVRVNVPEIGEVALSGRQVRNLDKKLAEKREE